MGNDLEKITFPHVVRSSQLLTGSYYLVIQDAICECVIYLLMNKLSSSTSLNIARILYLIVCEFAGMALAFQLLGSDKIWVGMIAGLFIAMLFMYIEHLTKNYTIRGFSTGTFGLLIGIFCAWLLTRVGVPDMISSLFAEVIPNKKGFNTAFNTMLFASLGFLATVIALRSGQDDFAVIIPYVRFRADAHSGQPILLDTDMITDGRLPAIMQSGFLAKNIIIPWFVLEELQVMSNSPSPGRKQRGQSGLECLEILQTSPNIKVTVHNSTTRYSEDSNDAHLIKISQMLNAKILTTDENLTKIARLQNVDILDLNKINDALKPKVDVGTKVKLPIVRTGKEEHQGVGYLPDGTMIVVNNGISKIGTIQNVTVISTINTSAGLMVFAEMDDNTAINA